MASEHELFAAGVTRLSMGEFNQLSSFVYEQCGIKMPPSKKIMLESRLNKRLRALNIPSFKDYIPYLMSKEGQEHELIHMIDVVTTNKTDFFREPHHFDYLRENILPEFVSSPDGRRPFRIWSAACSTGEEPYTLAMVLHEFQEGHRNFDYQILASDISTAVLQKAAMAVYDMQRINGIPLILKKKFFLKSKDNQKPSVRIIPSLRKKVQFQRINFMERLQEVDTQFDVIFCRNVLIYFDRPTQQEVVQKLSGKLKPGGYLFIGHSESLYQLDLPIVQIKPTIYQKTQYGKQ